MRINRLLMTLGMVFSLSSYSEVHAEQYCDPVTGMAGPVLKNYMDIGGIQRERHFAEFDQDHILNLNAAFQAEGGKFRLFQRDYEFYKKGGQANFDLSDSQVERLLDAIYSNKEVIMPKYQPGEVVEPVCVIFQGGVEATMKKRMETLLELIKQGYKFDKILFSFGEPNDEILARILEEPQYKEILEKVGYEVYVSPSSPGMLENNLKAMKENRKLTSKYIFITDSTLAGKVEQIAKEVLGEEFSCLGVAVIPIKDWIKDLTLYGYLEAFSGDLKKAARAWLFSDFNFIARQINTEAKLYAKDHGLDMQKYLLLAK